MIGRTPATITAVRPLRHGVIADFEVTEQMLRHFIGRVHRSRLAHPRVMICAPSGITDVEQRALMEACLAAGARSVHLIEESLAAAIGGGLAIGEPRASVVVDVGGGTSEVAVISLGGIVVSRSLRTGGYDLDETVAAWLRNTHGLAIGETTAERVKLEIGGVNRRHHRRVHRGARPRSRLGAAARGAGHERGAAPRARGAGAGHRGRGEGRARGDAARARRGHLRARPLHRRRRRAAARVPASASRTRRTFRSCSPTRRSPAWRWAPVRRSTRSSCSSGPRRAPARRRAGGADAGASALAPHRAHRRAPGGVRRRAGAPVLARRPAGRPRPRRRWRAHAEADLCIVGGGFTGLWAALHAKSRDPARDVVVLEADERRLRRERAQRRLPHRVAHPRAGERRCRASPTRSRCSSASAWRTTRPPRDLERHGIDADFEATATSTVALEDHEVAELREEAEQLRALRPRRGAVRPRARAGRGGLADLPRRPLGPHRRGRRAPREARCGPARRRAAAGVRVFEHTPVDRR